MPFLEGRPRTLVQSATTSSSWQQRLHVFWKLFASLLLEVCYYMCLPLVECGTRGGRGERLMQTSWWGIQGREDPVRSARLLQTECCPEGRSVSQVRPQGHGIIAGYEITPASDMTKQNYSFDAKCVVEKLTHPHLTERI